MSIWFIPEPDVQSLARLGKGTMSEWLGMEWKEIGDDYLSATLPVDSRTCQPYGYLHGGATCVLAETLGSVASALVIDTSRFICLGLEINANHIRTARDGKITGLVKPIHLGKSTHVWDIRITDEKDRLISVSRLTVAILPRKDQDSPTQLFNTSTTEG